MSSTSHTENTRSAMPVQRASADAVSSAGLSLPAVPVLQQSNLSNKGAPVLQAAGWTHDVLMAKIEAEMPAGVCNALTAAYIAGVLETDATDNTTGVDAAKWEVIKSLKIMLDTALIALDDEQVESKTTSFAFQSYLQEKGQAWLRDLPAGDIPAEAAAFEAWFRAAIADGDMGDLPEKECGGLYTALTDEIMSTMIDDALDDSFAMNSNFNGIVVLEFIKRAPGASYAPAGRHQFAIKHTPSDDLNNNKFSVFDQNSGIQTHVIQSDDDITDRLITHLRNTYITRPVRGTVGMSIKVSIDFDDDDE